MPRPLWRASSGCKKVSTVVAAFVAVTLAGRSRAGAKVAIVARVVVGIAAIGTYNHQIKRFWDEIIVDWEAHERMLADPRNGFTG